MQKIVTHLWYDKEALEAAKFYVSLLEGSKIISKTTLHDTPSGTADMVTIELSGQEFVLLSAGPFFKFTPAVSFLIACDTADEVELLYKKLMDGGSALMPIDSYSFSKRYGWVMDKYGLSWQVMYMEDIKSEQKITPTLMFTGDQCGKTEEAIQFYASVFNNTKINHVQRYGQDSPPNKPGTIEHMGFTLENQEFAAMDSAYDHGFTFNEAISLIVNCDTQEEIDYYWGKLSAVPEAEQCGWLKDKYGFSWQIVPSIMQDMMQSKDLNKLAQVTEAFLKMKKFDIAELKKAYDR